MRDSASEFVLPCLALSQEILGEIDGLSLLAERNAVEVSYHEFRLLKLFEPIGRNHLVLAKRDLKNRFSITTFGTAISHTEIQSLRILRESGVSCQQPYNCFGPGFKS